MTNDNWLTDQEGGALVALARRTIEAAVRDAPLPELSEAQRTPGTMLPLGAFVTLKMAGDLRGCIGEMNWERPVHQNVVRAAVNSALEDWRFQPLSKEELPRVQVEVTVLGPLEVIPNPEHYDVARHGIYLELGRARAIFLPQVAREYGWTREEMLAQLCQKAGLAPDAWYDRRMIFKIYTAQEFSEKAD